MENGLGGQVRKVVSFIQFVEILLKIILFYIKLKYKLTDNKHPFEIIEQT
jgi:hypothetical protein